MRIGMMLRAYDELGGIGVYARNLMDELLAIDQRNQYVLFFQTTKHMGQLAARFPNVTERLVPGDNRLWWDQVAIPLACRREKVDLIFNPKFSAPLLAPCKAMMVYHGADWFIPEHAQYYDPWDVRFVKVMMPLYSRKCTLILSVSQITTDNFVRILKLPPDKVQTTYFGPALHFRRITDPAALAAVREKYRLPERFVLTLSGYDRGRRKNIDTLLESWRLFAGKTPHALVVGGKGCERFREDYRIPADGWGKTVLFPGWLDQADLPAIYSLADLYLYPSNVEAFPIPITEAMVCGTPIVTSDLNGLREIAGDAARFVDAADPASIAAALQEILTDPALAAQLSAKGLERSKIFSWKKCARETLAWIESVGGVAPGAASV
jgi:glycosyltransferase involved in cell wall biosynthesis